MAKIRMQMRHIIIIKGVAVADVKSVNPGVIEIEFGGVPAVIYGQKKLVMRDPHTGRFKSLPCEV